MPLEEYIANLKKIIAHPCITAHNPKVVLIAPSPIDEHLVWANDAAQGRKVISRHNIVSKQYSEAVVELGAELGVPVVDLWKAFMSRTGWKEGEPLVGSLNEPRNEELEKLMYDGLHFTPLAYQVLFEEFSKTVREHIPELAPENVPLLMPVWNDTKAWEEWDNAHS